MKNSTAAQKEICTLAYAFSKDTMMARHVSWAQTQLKEAGISGESAKMGTHLTVFHPFYATRNDALIYAAMVQAGSPISEKSQDAIKGTQVGYFPPASDNSLIEAIHLRVELDSEYKNFISRIKGLDIFEWVHPPLQTTAVEPVYIPHIHLLEGIGIIDPAQKCEKDINLFFENRYYPLGELRLFIKKPGKSEGNPLRWEQVLV